MKRTAPSAPARPAAHVLALAALALLLALGHTHAARAQWATSGTNISNTNTGNVGVGTSNPDKKLVVVDGPSLYLKFLRSSNDGLYVYADGNYYGLNAYDFTNQVYKPLSIGWGQQNLYLARDGGNVGIGNTAPGSYRLNVSGPILGQATYTTYTADGLYGATALPSRINTYNGGGGGILFGYEDWGAGDYSPRLGLQQTHDAAGAPYVTTARASIGLVRDGSITIKGGAGHSEYMRVSAAGSVGVGTASPAYRLDVQGGQVNASGGLCIAGVCKSSWSEVGGGSGGTQWTTAGSSIHYGEGNVGVGVATPNSKLHVVGPVTGWGPTIRADGGGDVVLASGGSLFFDGNYSYASGNYIRPLTTNTQSFFTSGVERVRISATGNVGIGTSTPDATARLHVAGNIKATGDLVVDGNLSAKYQDVAEWVPTTQKLQAGTVVVLDPSRSNHVLASASSYDTSVAGVVSEQPGIILGEAGEGKVKVATTGRVRVKVDATKGAIKIGDLLVTSGTPGVAMKSEAVSLGGVTLHRPGTIIGKALEPLAAGRGEILALLSMQ